MKSILFAFSFFVLSMLGMFAAATRFELEKRAVLRAVALSEVLFEEGEVEIRRQDQKQELSPTLDALLHYSALRVRVRGHSSNTAKEKDNEPIRWKRADATIKWLINPGGASLDQFAPPSIVVYSNDVKLANARRVAFEPWYHYGTREAKFIDFIRDLLSTPSGPSSPSSSALPGPAATKLH